MSLYYIFASMWQLADLFEEYNTTILCYQHANQSMVFILTQDFFIQSKINCFLLKALSVREFFDSILHNF